MRLRKKIIFVSVFFLSLLVKSQHSDSISFFKPATTFNKARFTGIVVTEATLYVGSLTALSTLWYAGYTRSAFHGFNDNDEWLQMDKMGHLLTSYYIGRTGINLMRWSGVKRKKAIWYGGLLGSVYQSTIEVLDGFSSQWGFSGGDFVANTLGSTLVIAQELAWDEQRISFKYSFHQTNYPAYRPNLLGKNLTEQLFKDYNGQTYWLSANISSLLPKETRFPKWLNVAVGTGAEGMIGAVYNPPFDKNGNPLKTFDRYRKFYFSIDADLSHIKTKSHFLKALFNVVGFIKVPMPTIELSEKGFKAYGLYF